MLKLTSMDVMPESLFITGVKMDPDLMIAIGGFGRVFGGNYEGKQVALKFVDRGHKEVTSLSFFFLPKW